MRIFFAVVLAAFFLLNPALAPVASASLDESQILVYDDKGVCDEACPQAIGDIAEQHLSQPVRYVSAKQITAAALKKAKLWIQPGGDARDVSKATTKAQKNLLRTFVAEGGSYFGICAGAFFADHTVDDENTLEGLGFIPGESKDFLPGITEDFILEIFWGSLQRFLYFSQGATFKLNRSQPVEVIARYDDGQPAVVQFKYGKGTVLLSGPHPEAPESWKEHLNDPDGSDYDLTEELLDRVSAGLR